MNRSSDEELPDRIVEGACSREGDQGDSDSADSGSLQEFINLLGTVWSQISDSASQKPISPVDLTENTLFNRFRIRRVLGEGGFGVVLLADDSILGRAVALKLPRVDVLTSPSLRARFAREAHAAAAMKHPNIVTIYEAGDEGPCSFIVSAFCDGPNLGEWLKQQQLPLTPRIAARIVLQLANGVHHAHQRGILHRDVKPANVLMEPAADQPDGLSHIPLLTDFGLAKQLAEAGSETRTGITAGTTRYMAPEQLDSNSRREVSVATDVHGLGTILYELLSGKAPFHAADEQETIRRIKEDDPRSLRAGRSDLPRDLETICLKCLEKEPAQRYPSAQDLADDLGKYLAGDEVTARPLRLATRTWRKCRRRPVVTSLSAALVVVGIVAGAAVTSQWRRAVFHAAQVERSLIDAEQNQVNWAWVLEEFHHLGYSNDSTNQASRENLKRHYQDLLDRSDPDTQSAEFLAARTSFEARKAILSDDLEGAQRFLDASYDQWRQVLADSPTNRTAHRALADILYLRIVMLQKTNAPAALSYWFHHESVQFSVLLREEPQNGRVCAEFALLLKQRGDCLFHLGHEEESAHAYEAALGLWSPICERFNSDREYQVHHCEAFLLAATRKAALGNAHDALVNCIQADTILVALLAEHPQITAYRRLHAQVHHLMGELAQQRGELQDAKTNFEVARGHLRDIYNRKSATSYDTNMLISTDGHLGELHLALGSPTQALASLQSAVDQSYALTMDRTLSDENSKAYASMLKTVGDLHLKDGNRISALSSWQLTCHMFKYRLANGDDEDACRLMWADAWEQIARLHEEDGHSDEARQAYASAMEVLMAKSFLPAKSKARNERVERIERALAETASSNSLSGTTIAQ